MFFIHIELNDFPQFYSGCSHFQLSSQFLKSLAIYLRLRTVIISGVETFEELIDPLDKPNALFHNKWVHIHFRASISRLPLACRCYARHEESMKMYHDNYRRAPLSVPRPIYRPFANIELTRYWILIRSQLLRSLSLNPACQIPIKSPPFHHLPLPSSLADGRANYKTTSGRICVAKSLAISGRWFDATRRLSLNYHLDRCKMIATAR